MDKELFDDLIASTKEAIEHEKGNIELKTHRITVPNDDYNVKIYQLPIEARQALMVIIDNMLVTNQK